MPKQFNPDEERLLAAVAAALLGGQGAPVWTRTAESLLLASPDVSWHFRAAQRSLDDVLGGDSSAGPAPREGS